MTRLVARGGALALCTVAACAEPSVMVTVAARPTVHAVRALDVTVRDPDGDAEDYRFVLADPLPRTFTIATAGRDGPIAIELAAVDGGGEIVATGATFAPVADDATATVLLEPADFVVSSTVTGWQQSYSYAGRSVAVAGDGGFLVTFSSTIVRTDVLGRLFDRTASPRIAAGDGDFPLDPEAGAAQAPSVVASADRYLLTWNRGDFGFETPQVAMAALRDVDGRPLTDPAPLAADVDVNRSFLAAAPTASGWAVLYRADDRSLPPPPLRGGADYHEPAQLRAVVIGPDGAIGPERVVLSGLPGFGTPSIAGRDGFAIATVEADAAGSRVLTVRTFDAAAAPTGAPVAIPSEAPTDPRLAASAAGFALTWTNADATESWVALVTLTPAGAFAADPARIAPLSTVAAFDVVPDVAVRSSDGAIAVVWADQLDTRDGTDVFLRLATPDGRPCGDPIRINTTVPDNQDQPSIAAFGPDAFLIVWTDDSHHAPDPSETAVRARVVYADLDGCGRDDRGAP